MAQLSGISTDFSDQYRCIDDLSISIINATERVGTGSQRNHLSIYPNPFNYTANLALNLKESSIMQFEIYNLRGQLIRGGSLGNCEPGETKFLLKAVDAEGKALQSGIYF